MPEEALINPFVLGAIRQRQIQEAYRRNMIRMDLAGYTNFLNPQLYTAYLNGAATPNGPAVSPQYLMLVEKLREQQMANALVQRQYTVQGKPLVMPGAANAPVFIPYPQTIQM